jgi:protein TonB
MQKLHQATWFGVSLTLHLAVALVLIVTAARNAERTPKAIMVVLDNLESADLQQPKMPHAPLRAVVRVAAPISPATPPSETLKPEQIQQTVPPVVVRSVVTNPAPEKNQAREVPKIVPEHTAGIANRPLTPNSAPQAIPTATEGRTSPEKAQQRYLKEHFTYIRDLITKQLVYPPMARKMRWSGKVIVAFTIVEDGTIHGIRVAETSGFPILDKSAMETVRSVAPFPKPPVRAEIVVPINFSMIP